MVGNSSFKLLFVFTKHHVEKSARWALQSRPSFFADFWSVTCVWKSPHSNDIRVLMVYFFGICRADKAPLCSREAEGTDVEWPTFWGSSPMTKWCQGGFCVRDDKNYSCSFSCWFSDQGLNVQTQCAYYVNLVWGDGLEMKGYGDFI